MTRNNPAKKAKFGWNFREMGKGEPERQPRESEFFIGGDLDIPSSLVREIIQNSLDARRQTPVHVRFSFISRKMSENRDLFGNLLEHLRASNLLDTGISGNSSISLFVAEDFNTLGLTGNLRREEIEERSISNYYNFWWREGIAQKGGRQGGRWGLGKVTFYVASRLRSIWGFTVRHDDRRALLLGKCLLRPHRYNGKFFDCYGYFSDASYSPVEDPAILEDFRNRSGITRQSEQGLSIVIPMAVEEVTPEATIRSAIMYYFLPIIKGELIIEVQREKRPQIRIDNSNLREIAQAQSWEGTPWQNHDIDSLMDFIESMKRLEDGNGVIPLSVLGNNQEISEDIFGDSLERIRNEFRDGNLVAFRIPVRLTFADGSTRDSFFSTFIKKDEELEKSEEFYWRSGILIPGIRMLGRQRVRALLSASDETVCGFLGDSETPAHTDWNERTEGFKKKYRNAVATLRIIKGSIREIVRIIDIIPAGRETDFLKEIFHIREVATETDNKSVKPPRVRVERKPPLFEISPVSGGFRLCYLVDPQVKLPLEAKLTVAYDIRRGNPFKNYSLWDFDLSRMKCSITGGHVLSMAGNEIIIRVEKQNFKLEIKGFDPKRDVVIRIPSPRKNHQQI